MDFHGPLDPVYTISVAARLLCTTPQFLRQIEGEGLISPKRTESNIRLYSDADLKVLARVIYLWRDCGINPQGIRVILAMEEGDSPPKEDSKELWLDSSEDKKKSFRNETKKT